MGKLIRAWPLLAYALLILCIGIRAQYTPPSGGTGAPLNSPAFTGTPTAPTAPTGTNNTQIATTAFIQTTMGSMLGSGTFGSLSGSCLVNGSIYFLTNSYYNEAICNGSTWSYLLNGMAMVPPDIAGTFSSVNVTGSFDSTHGAGVINQPTAAQSVAGRFVSAPVTSTWHVILAYRYTVTNATNNLVGICTRNSGSGKIDLLGQYQNNGGPVGFSYTNPTTYSGTTFLNHGTGQDFGMGQPLWLRFGQGGGNQTWDWSNDQGVTWINLLTESATARFTVDTVGYCANGANTAIAALHWAVTL